MYNNKCTYFNIYDERKEKQCTQFIDQGQDNELRCMGIYLSDVGEEKIEMINSWLQNPWSGYPDLLNMVKDILRNCSSYIQEKSISGVPLENIEGHYRLLNNSKIDVKHNREKLINAYINAWKEKNGGFQRSYKDSFAKTIKAGCSK